MRLINTDTLAFEEFEGTNIPEYAILSHRWQDQEVLFKDFRKRRNLSFKGWTKVKKCCEFARKDGHKHVWIDTCCIDKSSSAELSEAINSMYQWYERSAVCYAYLYDVDMASDVPENDLHELEGKQANRSFSSVHRTLEERKLIANLICASEWFERGWTLQELVAPRELVFLGASWHVICNKQGLSIELSKHTHIPRGVLKFQSKPYEFPIAEVMSWASDRKTLRDEDQAYCLMGLFQVNMPLIYGEGEKAFRRLQEEIIRNRKDDSFLLFDIGSSPSIFATHPKAFKLCQDQKLKEDISYGYRSYPTGDDTAQDPASFSLSNTGLSIQRPIYRWDSRAQVYVLKLNTVRNSIQTAFIFLQRNAHGMFYRVKWVGESMIYGPSNGCIESAPQPAFYQVCIADVNKSTDGIHSYPKFEYLPSKYKTGLLYASRTSCIGIRRSFSRCPLKIEKVIARLAYRTRNNQQSIGLEDLEGLEGLEGVSGQYEIQSIVRCKPNDDQPNEYYILCGHEGNGNPFLLTTSQFPTRDCTFDEVLEPGHTEPYRWWFGNQYSLMTLVLNPSLWGSIYSNGDIDPNLMTKLVENPRQFGLDATVIRGFTMIACPGVPGFTCTRGRPIAQPIGIPGVMLTITPMTTVTLFELVPPGNMEWIEYEKEVRPLITVGHELCDECKQPEHKTARGSRWRKGVKVSQIPSFNRLNTVALSLP